jgi:dUTP pyrophosphatase
MSKIKIKKLNELAVIPTRGKDKESRAAGYDLYSTENYILKPLERKCFQTGIAMSIPPGQYGRIAPRSGLARDHGIDTMAGVIDEDYTGEIGVILINLGTVDKEIKINDKIAQIIFENYNEATFDLVTELKNTARGIGAYGSSDIKVKPKETVWNSNVSLSDMYKSSGGISVKEKYTEEIKKRESQ